MAAAGDIIWAELRRLDSLVNLLKARAGGIIAATETIVRVPFTFADASPKLIHTLKAGQLLNRAAVVITTAFDGAGASLQLGSVATPTLLFGAGMIDVSAAADTFDNAGLFEFGTDQPIQLVIVPGGGATVGAGEVLLKIKETPT